MPPEVRVAAEVSGGDAALAEFATQSRRLHDRLRTMSLDRLQGGPAEAVRDHLQWLADAAAAYEPGRPVARVPEIAPAALGDLVAILSADLAEAVRRGAPESGAGLLAVASERTRALDLAGRDDDGRWSKPEDEQTLR